MQRSTLIVIQVVAALLWPIWIFTAFFAPMLFTNGVTIQAQILLGICVAMPLLSVVFSISMWIGHSRSKHSLTKFSATGLLLVQLPLRLFVL